MRRLPFFSTKSSSKVHFSSGLVKELVDMKRLLSLRVTEDFRGPRTLQPVFVLVTVFAWSWKMIGSQTWLGRMDVANICIAALAQLVACFVLTEIRHVGLGILKADACEWKVVLSRLGRSPKWV